MVLCGGATKPNDFFTKTEGRNLKGIHFAMEFLHKNTKSLLDSQHADGEYISAKDRDVIVIGGGDTGTDCVGTSLRHGCKSLLQLEIVPQPPLERAPDNPWPQWPKVYRLDYGQEEAKALWGDDPRRYAVQTTKFLGDDDGHVKAIEMVQVEWVKNNGRAAPRNMPGTEKVVPAQLCSSPWASPGPESQLLDQLGVEKDPRSNAKAEHGKFQTSVPNESSPPATCGAARAWWCGPSTRGAARPASATASSWARRRCRSTSTAARASVILPAAGLVPAG